MICPKCKKKIEEFNFEAVVEHSGKYSIDSECLGEEFETKNYGDWDNVKFFCPECDTLITENQDEAYDLLKDGDNKK